MPAPRPASGRSFELRNWVGLAGVILLALWVRAGLIPAFARHGWEGHEAEYLAVFQGDWHGHWSTRVVPLLGWSYRQLGRIGHHEHILVVFSLLLGLGSIAALVVLVRRLDGPGLLAGLLVALCGNHAFWSSSAYNVIAPHTLWISALAALTWRGWAATVLSALLLGAAAGTRYELITLALPAMLLLHQRSWLQRICWALCVGSVWLGCLLPVLQPGDHPQGLLQETPQALLTNLLQPVFLQPWDVWYALVFALVMAALGLKRHRLLWALFVGIALTGHLTAAGFADSGFRQALTPGVALCVLHALGIAALADGARKLRGAARLARQCAAALALAATVTLLVVATLSVATRYYAPSAPLMAELEAENPAPVDPAFLARCHSELLSQPTVGTPLAWADHSFSEGDCWHWKEDWQHRRWTSLGVHDRGMRLHRVFSMRAMGMQLDPDDPGRPPRQVWLIEGRR